MDDGTAVRKRPYMGSMISEGGDGHGVLMMDPSNISMPALAASFAKVRV